MRDLVPLPNVLSLSFRRALLFLTSSWIEHNLNTAKALASSAVLNGLNADLESSKFRVFFLIENDQLVIEMSAENAV